MKPIPNEAEFYAAGHCSNAKSIGLQEDIETNEKLKKRVEIFDFFEKLLAIGMLQRSP